MYMHALMKLTIIPYPTHERRQTLNLHAYIVFDSTLTFHCKINKDTRLHSIDAAIIYNVSLDRHNIILFLELFWDSDISAHKRIWFCLHVLCVPQK